MAPLIGFHSVIESPLSVSRVIPPMMTIIKTSAAVANKRFESESEAASSWRSASNRENNAVVMAELPMRSKSGLASGHRASR